MTTERRPGDSVAKTGGNDARPGEPLAALAGELRSISIAWGRQYNLPSHQDPTLVETMARLRGRDAAPPKLAEVRQRLGAYWNKRNLDRRTKMALQIEEARKARGLHPSIFS